MLSQGLETKSVELAIHELRGRRVILDSDLAMLFGTETKRLNQQVKRNKERFADFTFQLTSEEAKYLRSQNATAKPGPGGRTNLPWAYDEHGIAMASTVLNTPRAIEALRLIIRVFTVARAQMLSGASAQQLEGEYRPLRELSNSIRTKLFQMAEAIADFEINKRDRKTVKDEFDRLTGSILDNVKAQLEAKVISNESALADIQKKIAETEKLYAEAREVHSRADQVDLQNAKERYAFIREMATLIDATDPTLIMNSLRFVAG